MTTYEFKITMVGMGITPKEAWTDAVNYMLENIKEMYVLPSDYEVTDEGDGLEEEIARREAEDEAWELEQAEKEEEE